MSVIRPAAYAPDARVADLRTAEMYVVCAARLWVADHRGAAGAARDLRRGFATAGVAEEGLAGLCRFFDTVAVAAGRSLDIRCVKCPHLGDDEAVLLQGVSLLQHGLQHGATMLFADWLPAAALRAALPPLSGFAAALAGAGPQQIRDGQHEAERGQAELVSDAELKNAHGCDRGRRRSPVRRNSAAWRG